MSANPPGCRPATYARRGPKQTVLYRLLLQHLETYRALACAGDGDGHAVPGYVERELRRYRECGILAYGLCVGGVARCAATTRPDWNGCYATVHVRRSPWSGSGRPLWGNGEQEVVYRLPKHQSDGRTALSLTGFPVPLIDDLSSHLLGRQNDSHLDQLRVAIFL